MSRSIVVENLSKKFRINHELKQAGYRTLRESLARAITAPLRNLRHGAALGEVEDFWALKDVNFAVAEGEALGVIGRNGAGKSTLLKILTRITEPTTGRAVIRGRVGSLLEVGTGFHPELTGRENVFLNGAILGMSRQEIKRRFDEIVAFSGVEKFIDTPIKRYSSGMKVRLAFAVAAHLDLEVLIIDEVLAVGDVEFQRKCLGKMEDVTGQGRTVLFVSHNMAAMRTLTSHCLFLEHGKLAAAGTTSDVVEQYLAEFSDPSQPGYRDIDNYRHPCDDEAPARLTSVCIGGSDPRFAPKLCTNSSLTIVMEIDAQRPLREVCMAIILSHADGNRVTSIFSPDQQVRFDLAQGFNRIVCELPKLPLSPGQYVVDVGINATEFTKAYDVVREYPLFNIVFEDSLDQATAWKNRPWGSIHIQGVSWNHESNNGLSN